jgi:hypothetical protein
LAIKDWSTQYPTNLDTVTQQPAVLNSADVTRASQINTMRDCVQALQAQVGSNNIESGTLRDRVADLEAAVGALGDPAMQTGITAFAGGGQGSATQLSSSVYFHFVDTVATQDDSVKLPDNTTGQAYPVVVKNRGVARLAVFPFTGGAINALGTNVAINLRPEMQQWFIPQTSGPGWITVNVSYDLKLTGDADIAGNVVVGGLTASQVVETNGSKQLVSVASTGTGNIVRASSPSIATPTLTGTATAGNLIVSGLTASQVVETNGSSQLVSVASTGTGNIVRASSPSIATPTLTGLTTAASITASGTVTVPHLINGTRWNRGSTDNITAFAGGGQASATLLTTPNNTVKTCATHGDSVKLPSPTADGDTVWVLNKGAKDVAIYPQTGHEVAEEGTNNPFYLHAECRMGFVWESSTLIWRLHSFSTIRVDRGDTGAVDFSSFTFDGTFHDLDLSSIVPPSGKNRNVEATLRFTATAVGESYLKTKGNNNGINQHIFRGAVANDSMAGYAMMKCNSSRLLEYRFPSTTSSANIRIHAYWVLSGA